MTSSDDRGLWSKFHTHLCWFMIAPVCVVVGWWNGSDLSAVRRWRARVYTLREVSMYRRRRSHAIITTHPRRRSSLLTLQIPRVFIYFRSLIPPPPGTCISVAITYAQLITVFRSEGTPTPEKVVFHQKVQFLAHYIGNVSYLGIWTKQVIYWAQHFEMNTYPPYKCRPI